jgi:hypothetical protein
MRCTTDSPEEAGSSHVGSFLVQLRKLIETAADGERVAADIELRTTSGGENTSMNSINSILPERVGVGDAPNTLQFLFSYTTTPTIYLGQQLTRERLVGSASNEVMCFQLIIACDSVNYEGCMIHVAVIITY